MYKYKTTNHAKVPTECQACHKIIEVGQLIVRHHITYFPEKTVFVHTRCHALIHKSKTQFQDLKPDPRQVVRWYKKKGVTIWTHHTDIPEYIWHRWIDFVDNGIWGNERRKLDALEGQRIFWKEISRKQKIREKLNIKQTWSSCD